MLVEQDPAVWTSLKGQGGSGRRGAMSRSEPREVRGNVGSSLWLVVTCKMLLLLEPFLCVHWRGGRAVGDGKESHQLWDRLWQWPGVTGFQSVPQQGLPVPLHSSVGVLTPPAFACVLACGLSSFLLSVSQLWDGGCISQLTVVGDKESQGE